MHVSNGPKTVRYKIKIWSNLPFYSLVAIAWFFLDIPVENIVNFIFYTIVAVFVPTSIFGADINTLLVALIAALVNFTVVVCCTCAEYPKVCN
jgi:hypothetical protein